MVDANPREIAGLAEANLTATKLVADAYGEQQIFLSLPESLFGVTQTGPRLGAASEQAVEELARTLGRLTAVYESDMDRLYQTALAYQKELDDGAARAGALTP